MAEPDRIVIDVTLCDGCQACIKVCPMGCLEMNEGKAFLEAEEDCLL